MNRNPLALALVVGAGLLSFLSGCAPELPLAEGDYVLSRTEVSDSCEPGFAVAADIADAFLAEAGPAPVRYDDHGLLLLPVLTPYEAQDQAALSIAYEPVVATLGMETSVDLGDQYSRSATVRYVPTEATEGGLVYTRAAEVEGTCSVDEVFLLSPSAS